MSAAIDFHNPLVLKSELKALSEVKYQAFASKLIPTINPDTILGVRIPKLRKIAKRIFKSDYEKYLQSADSEYFEEKMLQAMVIGLIKKDLYQSIEYTARFVPKIDNWSVCDSFCSSLKIAKKEQSAYWNFLQSYFTSESEYEQRFALVMLKNYYCDSEYLVDVLAVVDKMNLTEYYAKMAAAWLISIYYFKFPKEIIAYLKANNLDEFTYKKSLQKIRESKHFCSDDRAVLKSLLE